MSAAGPFLIWGGGGHGKVVADLARATGAVLVGYVDRDPAKLDAVVEPGGARVVLLEPALHACLAAGAALPHGAAAVVPAIGHNGVRLACVERLGGRCAAALVHPRATVSPSAALGDGTVVFAGAVVNAQAAVGRAAIVNTGAVVEHDCVLGDGAHVSPGAVLAGNVRLGERAWVGAGATVIPGVRIGARAIVGAGAVVLRDVPDDTVVVGNPARVLRTTA